MKDSIYLWGAFAVAVGLFIATTVVMIEKDMGRMKARAEMQWTTNGTLGQTFSNINQRLASIDHDQDLLGHALRATDQQADDLSRRLDALESWRTDINDLARRVDQIGMRTVALERYQGIDAMIHLAPRWTNGQVLLQTSNGAVRWLENK